MPISQNINRISDKGSLKVSGSIIKEIARICMEIMGRTSDIAYNFDVITLYFAPVDGTFEQKERYDRDDSMGVLQSWLGRQADVSSTDVARALQALAYIIDTSNDPGDATVLADLGNRISKEYQRVGSPLS